MQRIDTALQPQGNLGGDGQGNFTGVVDFDLNDFDRDQWFLFGVCDAPCDMNCDGVVNALDIEFFINLLFNGATPCAPCTGATNGDGVVDAADIEGFIDCLLA